MQRGVLYFKSARLLVIADELAAATSGASALLHHNPTELTNSGNPRSMMLIVPKIFWGWYLRTHRSGKNPLERVNLRKCLLGFRRALF